VQERGTPSAVNRHVKSIDGLGRRSHADVLPL
jgi:hypothetical protein